MAKPASPTTEIRNLRSRIKEANRALESVVQQRDAYRARATKAEQEAAEWKSRFDILLRRDSGAI